LVIGQSGSMTTVDDKWYWCFSAKKHYIKDPVDGGKILRNDSRDMLFDWCETHCQGKFWIGMGFGQFELESDAALFLLTWG